MLKNILTAAAIGAAAVMASTLSASAAIVCQGNVCWHTHEAYDFPHEAGVVVHEDDWHWGPHEKFRFREHEGRGYWRGGRWIVVTSLEPEGADALDWARLELADGVYFTAGDAGALARSRAATDNRSMP